jgi:ubiquitin-conjugating enzyme E2 J1
MVTDPKGQLGGLETSDAVRRRLASESHIFRCSTCGKSNAEIIRECEESSKASISASEEIEIPAELKMGWKDEISAAAASCSETSINAPAAVTSEEEGPELAEGFVHTGRQPTVPVQPIARLSAPNRPSQDQSAHLMATPTSGQTGTFPARAQRSPNGLPGEVLPLWIDRTIVILAVTLVAVLLKVLLG